MTFGSKVKVVFLDMQNVISERSISQHRTRNLWRALSRESTIGEHTIAFTTTRIEFPSGVTLSALLAPFLRTSDTACGNTVHTLADVDCEMMEYDHALQKF